ncbi:MAG TPA: hypothetical protein VHB73_03565 [Alphaproteobacteria bacterium]|nr:hypothetical protein [Alphaproteobacteria bacterium]
MRPIAIGNYPSFTETHAPSQGEVLATTSLGQDQQGANIVAYIVRKNGEGSAQAQNKSSSANTNDPTARSAANFSADLAQTAAPAAASGTSARFITPDNLLSPLDKAKVNHLRTREGAVKKEVASLSDDDAKGLSFVYETGPDGRPYVVGMATNLVLQNPGQNSDSPPPVLTNQEHDRGIAAYHQRLGLKPPLQADILSQSY